MWDTAYYCCSTLSDYLMVSVRKCDKVKGIEIENEVIIMLEKIRCAEWILHNFKGEYLHKSAFRGVIFRKNNSNEITETIKVDRNLPEMLMVLIWVIEGNN